MGFKTNLHKTILNNVPNMTTLTLSVIAIESVHQLYIVLIALGAILKQLVDLTPAVVS